MSIGCSIFGGATLGDIVAAEAGSTVSVSTVDVLPADLVAPAPYLHFFELTPSGSSDPLRVVDWGDSVVDNMGKVDFDGKSWDSVSIRPPQYEESTTGRVPQMGVAINDPLRAVLAYVQDNDGLRDAAVKTRIIRHDQLSDPHLSQDRSFRIQRIESLEGPSRVQIFFGSPAFLGMKFPAIKFGRLGCHNVFERRSVFDGRNYCSYPSDELAFQTRQQISRSKIDSDTEHKLDYGWYVVRGKVTADGVGSTGPKGDNATAQDTTKYIDGETSSTIRGLTLRNDRHQDLVDDTKHPHIVYKKINHDPPRSSTSNIDVQTRAYFRRSDEVGIGPCVSEGQVSGIYVQPENDPSSWFVLGIQQTTTPDLTHLSSSFAGKIDYNWIALMTSEYDTESDTVSKAELDNIPVPTPRYASIPNALRVKIEGGTITPYVRVEDPESIVDDSVEWEDVSDELSVISFDVSSWSGNILVGLVNFYRGTAVDVIPERQFTMDVAAVASGNKFTSDDPNFDLFGKNEIIDVEGFDDDDNNGRFYVSAEGTDEITVVGASPLVDESDPNITITRVMIPNLQYEAHFSHLRFTAGGYSACNRTLSDCTARENVHQRNAFRALPDDIVRF